mmetsp:Transcript_39186/g.118419  ORF Transcript_39186/g.118419 Transcript_39186/m.118419 type:complete len:430 (-) Transcript_39186:480-1769(-)
MVNGLREKLPVLRGHDGPDRRAHDAHAILLEDAQLLELHRAVQRRLAAERAQDAVRPLPLDDLRDEVHVHWQEIHLVRVARRRLHRRDVRVDQDAPDPRLAQGLDRLAARVVELAGLPDGQATRPEHQDLPLVHRQGVRDRGHARGGRLRDVPHEGVEEEGRVGGPAAGLRVELHGEPRAHPVDDALVAPVVGVHHQRHPVRRQGARVDGEPVVLRRDVAALRAQVHARLIHAAVAKLHLVRLAARREGQELIAQAYPEDGRRAGPRHHRPQALDRRLAVRRVAGAVAQEEPVEVLVPEVIIPGHDREFDPQDIYQVPDDVVFDAAVDRQDVHGASGDHLRAHGVLPAGGGVLRRAVAAAADRRRQEHLLLGAGHLRGQIREVRVFELKGVRRCAALHLDLAQQRAVLSNQLGHRARVDAVNSGNALLL